MLMAIAFAYLCGTAVVMLFVHGARLHDDDFAAEFGHFAGHDAGVPGGVRLA